MDHQPKEEQNIFEFKKRHSEDPLEGWIEVTVSYDIDSNEWKNLPFDWEQDVSNAYNTKKEHETILEIL